MATTDTEVQNLIVNKLTYAQWKAAKTAGTLSETEAYEFTDIDTALQEKLTQGTGITIDNNTVTNAGVRSIATGSANGNISVNTNGTTADVAVKGLGSSAFVDTTTSVTSAETKTLTSGGAYTNLVRRLSSSAATGSTSQGVYVDATGQVQTCDAVTSTYSSTGTAPVNGTAVKSAIDAAIASVYKPAGSVAFANLPSPVKALNGNVYDVTDAFTTDSKFINSGESYPAGTNVVVINTSGSTYKYDVLPGFIDLTPYQKIETAVTHTKNTAAGDSKTPVYVASDGTATALSYTIETSVPSGAVFTDTKNTAGSTDTSSKIYLVGATSQAANPQTYSQDTAFVDANGRLNSAAPASDANDTTVATTKWVKDQSYVPTTRTVNSKALSSDITLSASDVGALPDSTIIPTITDTYSATSSDGMSGKAVASAVSGKQDSSTAVTHTVSTAVGSATNPVYIASDGTATATTYTLSKSVPSDAVFTDTTYSDMTGATGSAAGTHGLAPAPAAGDNTKFLRGDATWATVDALPSQTSQSGKFLTTNGTTASWANVDALPSQSGNSGKFLTTNGTVASWGDTTEAIESSLKTVNGNSLFGTGDITITQGVAWGNITGTLSDQTDLNNALSGKVPTLRTINSKALSSDITLTASDVGALPDSTSIPTITDTYSGTSSDGMSGKAVASALGSYVPTSRTVNSKALSSNITLTASDVGALPDSTIIPIVNNATLTIQKNSTNVATFTANASSNVTANISVPTKVSDLTNDSNYQTVTQVANSIATETTNRENADISLQNQIDAIVSSSDVFDIVGTYADLQAYDISTVPVNDIIKVLVDSTHNNAATYYRCVENSSVKSWSYIGSEGAYYTKGEADSTFVPQTRTVNGNALSSNITLTASDVGALPDSTVIPTETTVSSWGFTKNAGTVTSVNNTSPDANGNVIISTGTNYTAGDGIDITNNVISIDGEQVSTATIPTADNSTIILNLSDEMQTIAVKDNRSGNAIKTWTGTRSQYDAITTKDSNTLYNITDDSDVTLTLLNTLYPVGAIYIGTMNACPLQVLGVGTWTLVSSGRVLQGVANGQTVGSTVEAGLPNIMGNTGINVANNNPTGCFFVDSTITNKAVASKGAYGSGIAMDASTSSSIYGNSDTVQPPAYLVNIWERIQ